MPSFPSPCRDLNLRLAYKTNLYPYFFKRDSNTQYEGVYMEFWRTMAKILVCESLEIKHYDEKRFCEGSTCAPYFGGAIGRHEVFAPAVPVFLDPQDMHVYKYYR
ncbi:hypothetical protein PRIPAC_79998 [Pristionchus pacificus]|uniref:Uncharacterized protein n=1 Tax=Pristionchus pacificus TaxID=54126 RepID=A0A2A6C2Y8_PRIPA|nr:hypothetical protein PRIPAC_79998 [Pristionchus pacificus]|eukprot:PDM72534.1 hypothetical protein PRIPAC_38968 [Pristionchus pacificus]